MKKEIQDLQYALYIILLFFLIVLIAIVSAQYKVVSEVGKENTRLKTLLIIQNEKIYTLSDRAGIKQCF